MLDKTRGREDPPIETQSSVYPIRRRRKLKPQERSVPAALLAAALASCSRAPSPAPPGGSSQALLTDITAELGIGGGRREPWPDGRFSIAEISTGGVALFDADGDGRLDIYQLCHPPPSEPAAPAPNRLFLQLRGGGFEERGREADLDDSGYGSGVAIGDADGDGDLDVFVANIGADALYLNDGAGKFTEATGRAGLEGELWSSSAAFLDFDRDGALDLFVCRYVVDDPSRICRPGVSEPRDYCGPERYQGITDTLYQNRGDGAFIDVTQRAGIGRAWPGLGVVCLDFTGDGWVDIYVANDRKPNQLWVNRGDGTFADEALARGVALNGAGQAEAGMGVAAGDAGGTGRLDILVTNLSGETHTLYVAGEAGVFDDRSAASGLGVPSLPITGWGCGFFDIDHDGDLDIAAVNGRVARGEARAPELGPFWSAYAEPDQLFLNQGDGRFTAAGAAGGGFTSTVESSRGLAFGDLDRDGDLDLVVSNLDNTLRVYRNDAPPPGSRWLRVRALTGGRDALGALVHLEAGGWRQVRPVISAYGFSSASEPVAHFGLGGAEQVERLEVLWPDGTLERFPPPAPNGTATLRQGEGETAGPRG